MQAGIDRLRGRQALQPIGLAGAYRLALQIELGQGGTALKRLEKKRCFPATAQHQAVAAGLDPPAADVIEAVRGRPVQEGLAQLEAAVSREVHLPARGAACEGQIAAPAGRQAAEREGGQRRPALLHPNQLEAERLVGAAIQHRREGVGGEQQPLALAHRGPHRIAPCGCHIAVAIGDRETEWRLTCRMQAHAPELPGRSIGDRGVDQHRFEHRIRRQGDRFPVGSGAGDAAGLSGNRQRQGRQTSGGGGGCGDGDGGDDGDGAQLSQGMLTGRNSLTMGTGSGHRNQSWSLDRRLDLSFIARLIQDSSVIGRHS